MERYPTQIRRGILESFRCTFLANDYNLNANPRPTVSHPGAKAFASPFRPPGALTVITLTATKVLSIFAICEHLHQHLYHRFQCASGPLPDRYTGLRRLYNDTRRLREARPISIR